MYVSAVITAGGLGTRMGISVPKQFIEIAGKPIIVHTIEKFNNLSLINEIVVVVPKQELNRTQELKDKWNLSKVVAVVPGGKERIQSVNAGLVTASADADIILIHDGVRPLVTSDDIIRVIEKTKETGAAILALPVTDTIKRVENSEIVNTLNRNIMWRAQTPQGFKSEIIKMAYKNWIEKGIKATDDSQLVEMAGICVSVVRGKGPNIKVTNPDDLSIVSLLMSMEEK